MKEKVVCGNLYQLADSVRLATPLARFGKVVRTASKQGVASSSLAGRATSLETHSIQRSNRDHSSPVASPPIIVSGKQGAPCGCLMPVQSYRHGNHLNREKSLQQPKRTRGVDCPVSLQRITPTTVRRAAWPKAGNLAELDPERGPREFARQGNDRLPRTSFA